jgi:hypothetical protein
VGSNPTATAIVMSRDIENTRTYGCVGSGVFHVGFRSL